MHKYISAQIIRTVFIMAAMVIWSCHRALAQCAMCRASVESTLSEGNIGIASRLNTGILYLFVVPYIAVAVVGYLWYRKSTENARKAEDILRRKKVLGID